jgi:valyl-tRNA synthetase
MEIAEDSSILVCLRDEEAQQAVAGGLEAAGLSQDPDVLDTWFSSAIWPHSTLGWPDPASARQNEGQPTLAADGERPDALAYYYPGSCLITGRDIITLWVARMVIMGLYNLGDLPFTDVFLHANILDGNGERMSKSKGNGIDPVDIIERYGADAMRYVLCEMQTGTQDIRLPVQAFSPFTGNLIDLAKAKHGRSIFTYLCPETGKEFDVLGTMDDLPSANLTSERFEVGRNFANKLWNATRFALLNLDEAGFEPRELSDLEPEDRWILSRLAAACAAVNGHLEAYNPAAAIGAAREFFWSELCDWYLELLKPRVRDAARAPMARQVLAVVLDQVLRLLHPFIPFLTEELWAKLGERAPERGIETMLPSSDLLTTAAWVSPGASWRDEALENRFAGLQDLVRAIRDLRSKYNVPPANRLAVRIRAAADSSANLSDLSALIVNAAGLESLEISPEAQRTSDCATAVVNEAEVFVAGVVDPKQERKRLGKQRDKLSGHVEGCRRKLGNENFISKARPDVVERERERLGELETQLANLDSSIAALE